MRSRTAGRMMVGAALLPCALLASGLPAAADATFTFVNMSGLSQTQAKFYFLGEALGANGNFYVLQKDGTWIDTTTPAAGGKSYNPLTGWDKRGWNPVTKSNADGSGVVPCHALTGSGVTPQQFVLPSTLISGRLYIFQVSSDNKSFATSCSATPSRTSGQVNGIFGTGTPGNAIFSYASTSASGLFVGPTSGDLKSGYSPPWAFAELAGSEPGDIDSSQVDGIGFPLNITAKMTPQTVSVPQWNQGVGFSFSPNAQVNMQAVFNSYTSFVSALPAAEQKDYSNLLVQGAGANGKTIPFFMNPGHVVTPQQTAPFKNRFLNLVNNYLWTSGTGKAWSGTINTGGAFSYQPTPKSPVYTLPQADFSANTVQVSYPGYSAKLPAIKFTAMINTNKVVAYVLSPQAYQTLCKNAVIAGCSYMSPASQIFAQDGAFGPPVDGNQFLMLSSADQAVWKKFYGGSSGIYNQLVGRLGLILSNAINRGVAGGLQSPGGLCDLQKYKNVSRCWSDQTNWYPDPTKPGSSTVYFNGDISHNFYANWLHTAQIGGVPMMTQPTGAIKSAAGKTMGMAYGFAYDENPTPHFRNKQGNIVAAQTPAEYSSNVAMTPSTGCNYITIMPWTAGGKNPKNPTPVTNPDCNVNGVTPQMQ